MAAAAAHLGHQTLLVGKLEGVDAVRMAPDARSHELEASAAPPSPAPHAAGFEAVIQHAVEHVTAFSASLEQRRAEAQLEQALTVCLPSISLLLSCDCAEHIGRIMHAPILLQDAKADFRRKKNELEEARRLLEQQLWNSRATAERDAAQHAQQARSDTFVRSQFVHTGIKKETRFAPKRLLLYNAPNPRFDLLVSLSM